MAKNYVLKEQNSNIELIKTDLFRRRGEIEISNDILFIMSADCIKELFSNFYPLFLKNDFRGQSFEATISYIGISPMFDIVEESEIPPKYVVILSQDEKGCKSIEFKKKKIMNENYVLTGKELKTRLRRASEENWSIKILAETSLEEDIFSILQNWPEDSKEELFLLMNIEEKEGEFYNKLN